VEELPIETLAESVRHLQGCEADWVGSVAVTETIKGETVWDGLVQVFGLRSHPTASRAYAWSEVVQGAEGRRFVAVLHAGFVDLPRAAVRAAIEQQRADHP
jgi:hypothetical protein